MAIVGLGIAPTGLDTSLNVAFPALSQALGLPVSSIQWIIVTYMLTFGALMLISGRLADTFGHLSVFRSGLSVAAAALLLGAVAPGIEVLALARIIQGIGAAAALSAAPALATFLYPESERIQALGRLSALFMAAQALGPILGGPLVEAFGWRAVFAFRIPIALAALVLSSALPVRPRSDASFDLAASALLTLSVASFLVTAISVQWPSAWPLTLSAAALGVAAAWAIPRLQRRSSALRPGRGSLAAPRLVALNLLNAIANAAGFAILMLIPFALAGRQIGPVASGFVIALASVTGAIASRGAPLLARATGDGALLPIGLGLCIAGLGFLGWAPAGSPIYLWLAALAVQGAGLGFFTVAYQDAITGALPVGERGLAGGIISATRTFGVVAGASLFSAVFRLQAAEAFDAAFALSFRIAAGLLLASSVLLLTWYWRAQNAARLEDAQ